MKSELKRLEIQRVEESKMTNAEIEKDMYYYAFNYRNASTSDANDWWLALERHAKKLEAITREKVLAEIRLLATCECGDGFTIYDRGVCVNCLASMPNIPVGGNHHR